MLCRHDDIQTIYHQLTCYAKSNLHLRFRDTSLKGQTADGGHGFPHGHRRLIIIFLFTPVHPHRRSPLLNPSGKILLPIFHFSLTPHSYCHIIISIVNVHTGILELNNKTFSNWFFGFKIASCFVQLVRIYRSRVHILIIWLGNLFLFCGSVFTMILGVGCSYKMTVAFWLHAKVRFRAYDSNFLIIYYLEQ